MRGLNTFLVNLPTLHHIYAKDFENCNDDNNQLGAKIALKEIEKLSDPKFIATIVGYCQIFNAYAECSLMSQHSRFFATTVMQYKDKISKTLEEWGDKWEWEDDQLKNTSFGPPLKMIYNLMQGVYTPLLCKNALTRATAKTLPLKNIMT